MRTLGISVLMAGLAWVPALTAETLKVVVSIPPQQWLVEQIGGDRVEVEVLVRPGESPTTYQPTDAQITRLLQSRLYFSIGVPFEQGPWFEALAKMGRLDRVDSREGIPVQGGDPHVWLNPRLLSIQAGTVAEALSRHDRQERDRYAANLEQLRLRLEALDLQLRRTLEPFSGRAFLVFHPSWGYFAAEYSLEQVAIESEGRQPSDRELTQLREMAQEAAIATVFVQPQIHARSAAAFAESIGAATETLDPLATDVIANLVETAEKLKASFKEGAPSGN